ncbi:TPA: PD-(D/E)XK nuclease family protein, partial [Candidatus Woesearchaeota archaeon]|nr:PD-(D/E)XK nuclease family protein [Candidatus Woesearchaeota archaeon]
MPKRVQSPSSINLFKQCPRRYFYQYILKYPTKQNIHCIRGNIVHTALEKFYDVRPETLDPLALKKDLAGTLKQLFDYTWRSQKKALNTLGLSPEELQFYYDDSVQQLANWLNHYFRDLDKEMKQSDFVSAWNRLKPHARELEFKDLDLGVRGFIDVIHKDGEDVMVVDYKTSKKFDITPEYRLQLGIYALLYKKQHGHY